MKKVTVTAKLLAPVALKRDRQSERAASVCSISGTQVRGALAALYLQNHGHVDATFTRLFLDETACRFGPLDPGPYHAMTAAACKRDGLKHGHIDLLWFRVAQHLMNGQIPEDAHAMWLHCGTCQADLKEYGGFWEEAKNGASNASHDRHHVATHVGIDRQTSTAAESILYTLEAMLPSEQEVDLHGWLTADDDALAALKALLVDEEYRISVGYHRTRGYGDVQLQFGEPIDSDMPQTCAERWEQWSSELIEFLGSPPFSVPDIQPQDFYFGLSLPTGAIFVDRFLRYSLDAAEMVAWLSPMSSPDTAFPLENRPTRELASGGTVRWITAVTRHERLHGWNAAHGLPRQDEWRVARGSVYVYCFQGTAAERERLLERLVTLSQAGIGLRRNEGFGTVGVSDDFHRQCHQQ